MNEELIREYVDILGQEAINAVRIEAVSLLVVWMTLTIATIAGIVYCWRRVKEDDIFFGGIAFGVICQMCWIGLTGQAVAALLYPSYWALRMLL